MFCFLFLFVCLLNNDFVFLVVCLYNMGVFGGSINFGSIFLVLGFFSNIC